MTRDEAIRGVIDSVKRSHYNARIGLRMFGKHHPDVEITPELLGIAVGVGRTPFPNIKGLPEGPFPVYKDKPWLDVRFWESEEQKAWEVEMDTLE